jgi:hypothetical protein
MDFVKHFSHVGLLAIVHDLDAMGAVFPPQEADAPWVADTDAGLPPSISLQGFQSVSGRNPQTGRFSGGMELQQLPSRDPFDVPEPWHGQAVEQALGVGTGE